MKQRIILLIIAISLYNLSYGQVSKETFEKAVDYLNCKSVQLSVSSAPIEEIKDDIKQHFKNFNCNDKSYENILKSLEEHKIGLTVKLSKEIDKLKKEYESLKDKSTQEVINYLTDPISLDKGKFPKLFNFANSRKDKDIFNAYKEDLKNGIKKILKVKPQQENNTNNSTALNQQSEEINISHNRIKQRNQTNKNQESLGSFSIFLIIFVIILGVFGLLFGLKERMYNQISQKLLDDSKLKNFIQETIEDNQKEIEEKILSLEGKLKKNNKLRETERILEIDQTYQEKKQSEPKLESKPEILYLSTPNPNGSFNNSSALSIHRESASIYKLTKIGNTNKAKFWIDEKESSIKLALNYPDTNIKPVCEVHNAFSRKKTGITTLKEGEVELQEGKWILITKAVIRYEN